MSKRSLDQRWATSRNWAKFRISSMYVYEGDIIFTPEELDLVRQINALRRQLIGSWEANNEESKKLYLAHRNDKQRGAVLERRANPIWDK